MSIFILSIFIFFIILCFLILLLTLLSLITLLVIRVPYAPIPKENIPLIFNQLKIEKGQIFYDLGSGDGRMILAAENYGLRARGYELSPIIYLKAKWNLWRQKSKSKIFFKNFLKVNLVEADIVYLFLVSRAIKKLKNKLEKQLRVGTRVISYGFPIPEWQPIKIIAPRPQKTGASKIYFYKTK